MGVSKLLGGLMMGKQKSPSQASIAAAQEKAAIAERNKLAQEQANKENAALRKSEMDKAKRAEFVTGITPAGDDTQRRRFLKGV